MAANRITQAKTESPDFGINSLSHFGLSATPYLKRWGTRIIMAAAALSSTACEVVLHSISGGEEGNGYASTEIRSVSNVRQVSIDGDFLVILREGYSSEVTITTDENLMGYFDATVFNGRLEISWSYPVNESFTPTVTIELPRVTSVEASGGAQVRFHDRDSYAPLDMHVSMNSSVDFFGIASEMTLTTFGSGLATVGGYAESFEGRVDGYGAIEGGQLLCDAAWVRIDGSGYAGVSLLEGAPLEAEINGRGHLEWWGWPSRKRYDITGEGRITEHLELLKASATASRARLAKGLNPSDTMK
jgi:hypothetical protein